MKPASQLELGDVVDLMGIQAVVVGIDVDPAVTTLAIADAGRIAAVRSSERLPFLRRGGGAGWSDALRDVADRPGEGREPVDATLTAADRELKALRVAKQQLVRGAKRTRERYQLILRDAKHEIRELKHALREASREPRVEPMHGVARRSTIVAGREELKSLNNAIAARRYELAAVTQECEINTMHSRGLEYRNREAENQLETLNRQVSDAEAELATLAGVRLELRGAQSEERLRSVDTRVARGQLQALIDGLEVPFEGVRRAVYAYAECVGWMLSRSTLDRLLQVYARERKAGRPHDFATLLATRAAHIVHMSEHRADRRVVRSHKTGDPGAVPATGMEQPPPRVAGT